jgi:phospholipase/carboxylesterase
VLGGFSQGGAVALYTALRHPEPLGGAAALSAYLVDGATLATEAAAVNRDLPLFMAHGTDDEVVLPAWGEASRDQLRDAGWRVEWHQYPMGHAAAIEEIEALGRFIAYVLA